MQPDDLEVLLDRLPRKRIGFYPTPFHKLENLSRVHGVNLFMKREDMAGPGALSGSKMRVAEMIIGQALDDGVDTIITQGAHLTNSGMQFATAALVAGLTPILFLTRDEQQHGELAEYRGNLLLDKLMDVETHYLSAPGSAYVNRPDDKQRVLAAMTARKGELEAQGRKVMIVPTGGAHPAGFAAHVRTFIEMVAQARLAGVELDYIYHTTGTGTALPGMLAAKLLTGHPVKFRSISISHYQPDFWINEAIIAERVTHIFQTFGIEPPSTQAILSEIEVDNRFIGDNYAVPSQESTAAIKELARAEGVFLGPVYTGKGFAGLLDHIRSGMLKPGSNIAFLHTGDTANLFEVSGVVGGCQ
ncbi:pyridoxal-phosphate dependent enzyme [Paraburkholderia sp. Ac-20340]|uniref:1-aminocyclopropane-1-carboxylate deaminase/D-cysteine desulfhydrase n=1 Tax=Paraburkholderia sp. Ac-20340 TaxID=2703888 RepID=UPI00197E1824|nr:pyridoxal-phosphate dependent enzyme [Paraburkholderia sp. Ac-20340]MBN3857872.1 pyridoxal-phosphate dependent enzyme [Paraburkholderia sp. Ac-20340]